MAPAGARSGGSAAQRAAHCFHVWLLYLKQAVLSKTYVLKYYSKCGVGRNIKHLLPFKEDTWRSSPRLSLLKPWPFSPLFLQPACPCSSVLPNSQF